MDRINGGVSGVDFFDEGALPAPRVTTAEAVEIARGRFGLEAEATPLGSQQDQNFLLSRFGSPVAVLKFSNRAVGLTEISAQDAASDLIEAGCPGVRAATTLRHPDGSKMLELVATSSGPLVTRVVTHLSGTTLVDHGHLSASVVARLGELAGLVSRALEPLSDPGLDRVLQWDLRHGKRVVDLLAEHVEDPGMRTRLQQHTDAAWARVQAVAGALPVQPGHLDLTDENVIATTRNGIVHPDGIIDLGDLSNTWRVAELAVTIASILHHPGAEPCTVLPAIVRFHELRELQPAEVEALWPLVVVRGAVLATSSLQQVAIDGEHTHASVGIEREWRIYEQAVSVPLPVMTGLIRSALGIGGRRLELPPRRHRLLASPDRATVTALDLSTESDAVDNGVWDAPDAKRAIVAQHLRRTGADAVLVPYGAPQLTEAAPLAASSAATIATGLELWAAQPCRLASPWQGELRAADAHTVELMAGETILVLSTDRPWAALDCEPGPVQPAAPLATLAAGASLTVQLAGDELDSADRSAAPIPPLVRPEYAPGWLALTADPRSLLDAEEPADVLDATAIEGRRQQLLSERSRAFASVQEHYYARPPEIERGWRHHMIGVDGRVYLDIVNNVTVLGHAHPRIERAVTRQLRRLNTNSRFHYASVAEYSARLAALLPEPLDTVFLVNSGSEAVDLALRLALAATGRQDVVAMREAYHGWTYMSDAVSTSVADNPNALETRPEWVHTVEAANSYRGRHRGAEASRYAPEAVAAIDALAAAGHAPAAFIAETFYGNAGGIALPDGYLAQVYAAVRRHGGVTIADEIQVGYGRLGEWFWGFEQQGVLPDIVTVAKAAGNGHPLGAVITSRELADRYRSQGYFFSSTGGSPVSCVIGMTVLDVLEQEGLQANARTVGAHLRERVLELAERHRLIGAVHGSGLYMGIELVRDHDTLEPAPEETLAICERLLGRGVIVQPTGDHQNVLKVKPPMCIDRPAADFFAEQLEVVLRDGW